MRFVDQRRVNVVPGLVERVIVREPQDNVAYWNGLGQHRNLAQLCDRYGASWSSPRT